MEYIQSVLRTAGRVGRVRDRTVGERWIKKRENL